MRVNVEVVEPETGTTIWMVDDCFYVALGSSIHFIRKDGIQELSDWTVKDLIKLENNPNGRLVKRFPSGTKLKIVIS